MKTSQAGVGWEIFSLFQKLDETKFFWSFEVSGTKLKVIDNIHITWKDMVPCCSCAGAAYTVFRGGMSLNFNFR